MKRYGYAIVMLGVILACSLTIAGCGSGSGTHKYPANQAPGASNAGLGDEPTATSKPMPTADSFTVGLKTISKQCFGSAGCSLTVQPTLTYNGGPLSDLDAYTCDVTYKIIGGSSGETIATAEGAGGSQFSVQQTVLETPTSATELSATVQDVTCQ